MYMVSRPRPLSDSQSKELAQKDATSFPPGYFRFLQRFGEGTYRGWMNVCLPDTEVLKPFAEYDLWEHDEDSPITQEQIGQCVAIGTTVDGDFLAVHALTDQLLWLPRHEEYVKAISLEVQEQEADEVYARVLDEIFRQVYGSSLEGAAYYEAWSGTQSHVFLRLPPEKGASSLEELAGECRMAFLPDLSIENQYVCYLFYRQLDGYVRFNYAYKQEVAVMFEQAAQGEFAVIEKWLLSKGCEKVQESK